MFQLRYKSTNKNLKKNVKLQILKTIMQFFTVILLQEDFDHSLFTFKNFNNP